jgi:hypothetical protein
VYSYISENNFGPSNQIIVPTGYNMAFTLFKMAQEKYDDITRFCQIGHHFISHLHQKTFETKSLIRRQFILGFS